MADMLVDYVVFVVFILVSVSVPLYRNLMEGKERTKAAYVFAAGSSVSMFAMMLSIARGMLGVKAFLGYPSELYYRGSAMWETLYGIIAAYPIVCFVFVPVYFNLGITSVYQYLDLRFKSKLVRRLASLTYLIRGVLNMGVTVFTPCVALKTVVGMPYWASIISITTISVVFTLLGGLKSAIHVDMIQGLVTIACSVTIIIKGALDVPGGVADVFKIPSEQGRLQFFDFDLDPTIRVATLSAVFGQLFMSLSIFGCQQNFVQRYISMGSVREVTKTLMTNIPVITVLFSLSWVVGMVIFANYVNCDPLSLGYISKIDEIVPFFVEDKFSFLPGFLGLVMGSLFNGALSIAVSNINSMATVMFEDFFCQIPSIKLLSDKKQVYFIKGIGIFLGAIITGIAFLVAMSSGVIESSMLMTSATSGPLLGVFVLAMLFPCCNWKGAALGMIVSHAVTLWITFGRMTVDQGPIALLPLSTEGCTNTSYADLAPANPIISYALSVEELMSRLNISGKLPEYLLNSTEEVVDALDGDADNFLEELYAITYMYYSLIGCGLTVFLGVVGSYITGTSDDCIYDEKLIHPLALKISKMFPGPPRKYTVVKVVEKQTEDKMSAMGKVPSENGIVKTEKFPDDSATGIPEATTSESTMEKSPTTDGGCPVSYV
ncbi:sodium-coupled monocarboxylate transporter 1 [Schistocerca gregaria]|uniref:sodium-coupled monocarboxylate transporter 1 n=1 Tax=Schistocerca gregaria TaxID=7010 RepID=UPI00211DE124|nr:sodium-coupled monocarboxylate transporter 1 [Schistocerca gregaria]XP_049860883.1 sodium-coupled monocarboxylate transporter 1 [Schistocerca gregaria]XP_049860884.1 sodium-coupled monocarboxylate transporter 1 [Schistocerca gregaria]